MTTKAELTALEKVFAAEIGGRLPFQSKAKIFSRLRDEGYLEPMERNYGTGWSAVIVTGYQLTHLGRLTYCATCADDEQADTGSVK